jgi:hypothetical protein
MLGYAAVGEAEMRGGVRRLAKALRQASGAGHRAAGKRWRGNPQPETLPSATVGLRLGQERRRKTKEPTADT